MEAVITRAYARDFDISYMDSNSILHYASQATEKINSSERVPLRMHNA